MSDENKTVVLVADDEPSTLALVSGHLRAKGYRVMEATDGDKAWELAHEHLPHVVVLDVMMPGMSGWEVCRKIREAVSLAHTGVVMLTGIGENLNEMTSPLYGADAYVDKPFEFSDLDAKIKQTLSRRKRGALGRPDKADVAAPADDAWDLTNEQAPKPALAKSAERSEQGAQTLTQRITKAARKVAQALNPLNPLARDAPLASGDGKNLEPRRRRRTPRSKTQKSDKPASGDTQGAKSKSTTETDAKTKIAKRARNSTGKAEKQIAASNRTQAPTKKRKKKLAATPSAKQTPAPGERRPAKRNKAPPAKTKRSAKAARTTRSARSAKGARSAQAARSAKRRPSAPVKRRAKQPSKAKGGAKRKTSTGAARAIAARAASGKRPSKSKKARAATKSPTKKASARKASRRKS